MSKIIQSIEIANFPRIKNCKIDFQNLNVFIGDNGTNKTSILEAINYAFSPSFLSSSFEREIDSSVYNLYELTEEEIRIIERDKK
ncbi:MAG: AAA family ATPase [Patescibacteria group bacterium]|nr:AAA family ATPase [Patescibacteria group bacterium]